MEPDAFSVGVEEEYQLVDPATGDLRSRARHVLASDWGEELAPEIQETMLEVGTRVCGSAGELEEEIRRLRLHVGSVAAAEDLTFVAAGLHPFSRWQGQEHTAGERYLRILDHFGRVMRTEHVFGMHVHVAVPLAADRVLLMNRLRTYLPHLLGLAASSPFYEGEDTGYASYRSILVRRLPISGAPPRFQSASEYRRVLELLLGTGALADPGTVYWNLRPHPRYPTLEFRVTDVCPRVADAAGIAALVRTLVVAAVQDRLPAGWSGLSASAEDALLDANEWQAARFGLDASLAAPDREEGREPLRDAVARLLDRLSGVGEEIGEGAMLGRVQEILERGNAAQRIREEYAERGGAAGLVAWLAGESQLGVGLDRRAAQRAER